MKSKHTIAAIFSLILLSWGCKKDFLDTKLDTLKTPEAIVTDRNTLFSSAYAFYLPLQDGFSAIDNNLFAAVSDEAQNSTSSFNALLFNQGVISPNINPEGGLYKTFYDGIRAANNFLEYSKNANEFLALNRDTITEAVAYNNEKQDIGWLKAEAHIARAYYYAELIKRWGGVPIVTKTFQEADVINIPRSTYDEVVDYIISEIDNNKANLQENWKTSSFTANDGRFSLGSALALKARVLLYAASPRNNPSNDITKWQKAAEAANEVIKLGYYSLNASYGVYFIGSTPISSNETIFALRQPPGNEFEKQNYPIATPGGRTGLAPSDNLVSAYEYIGIPDPNDPYKNRDPRLSASIVTNGSTWNNRVIDESAGAPDDMANPNASKTGYYLKKFLTDKLNLIQGGTAQHNWVIFRYGELLLDFAEAMNEAYGPDNANGYTLTARQALQKVRDRASTALPAITATSKEDFRDVVKHERRVELAFEGYRYWDLRRWKDAEVVLNKPIMGVKVTKVSSSPDTWSYQKRDVADRVFKMENYYYPFSRSEIVNSNGVLKQNPGYN